MGNWRKRKGSKESDYGKGSRETRCLIEGHTCLVAFVYEGNNNVDGETPVTKKLSFESSEDQIQYRTMCERSIMWYCSHELLSSCFEMGMA